MRERRERGEREREEREERELELENFNYSWGSSVRSIWTCLTSQSFLYYRHK